MQPSVTFNTQNTNWYLYSTFKSEFIYIHPILAFIINNESALFSLETDVERATILKKLGEYSFEDINYYLSKFEFLKNNNYFKINQRITQPITSEIIKDGISKCEAITFEVTENCNLNCKYCGYGEYYENYEIRTNQNIDLTNSFALIDLLFASSKSKNCFISFYGGEPLLNIDTIKIIIDYIKTKDTSKSVKYNLTTNALLLKKNIDFLVENDFLILISLDGNENHNRFRVYKNGQQAFNEIIDNISYVYNKYPDYFRNKININSVIHDQACKEIVINYIESIFNKKPQISNLSLAGLNIDKKKEFFDFFGLTKLVENNKTQDYQSLNLISERSHNKYTKLRDLINESDLIGVNNPYFNSTITCIPFSINIFLSAKNSLLPCEKTDKRLFLGKFNYSEDVNIDFDKIAEVYNLYRYRLNQTCRECYHDDLCTKCMYQLQIVNEKIHCEEFLNKIEFCSRLSLKFTYQENKILSK